MSQQIILYDLREQNYPNWRGAEFRSLQVFECRICGALTNRVIMGGWPGYGIKVFCPYNYQHWHHEIEMKMSAASGFRPESYKEELRREAAEIKIRHEEELKNDLVGNPSFSLRQYIEGGRTLCRDCWAEGWF